MLSINTRFGVDAAGMSWSFHAAPAGAAAATAAPRKRRTAAAIAASVDRGIT